MVRMVFPLVIFSPDLLVWLFQVYDDNAREFKKPSREITFSLKPQNIREMFSLKGGAQTLCYKSIVNRVKDFPINVFEKFFLHANGNKGQFPFRKKILKIWAMDYVDMINAMLGTIEFEYTTRYVLAIVHDVSTLYEVRTYEWESFIHAILYGQLLLMKISINQKKDIKELMPYLSYYSF